MPPGLPHERSGKARTAPIISTMIEIPWLQNFLRAFFFVMPLLYAKDAFQIDSLRSSTVTNS